jgi:hypothetical protein
MNWCMHVGARFEKMNFSRFQVCSWNIQFQQLMHGRNLHMSCIYIHNHTLICFV